MLLTVYITSVYVWSESAYTVGYSNALCIVVIVAMLAYIVLKRWDLRIIRPLVYVFVFDVFCVVSILWASDPSLSVKMAFKTLPLLSVFCFVLWNFIVASNRQESLIFSIYVSGLILAVYTVYMQGGLGGYLALLSGGARVGGNVANVNTIGMAAGFSSFIAFYYLIFKKKPIHLIGLATCVVVALGTGSNKALVVIFTGCFVLLVLHSVQQGTIFALVKMLLYCVIVGAVFVALLQLPMFETVNDRFAKLVATFTGSGETEESALRRMLMIHAGFEQFLKTPFIGIGINNGSIVALESAGINAYLHNNFIELLVDCGLIGTILFYLSSFSSLKRMIDHVRGGSSTDLLVVVILVSWLILQWGYVCYFEKTTYVYLALAAACAFPIGDFQDSRENHSLLSRGRKAKK